MSSTTNSALRTAAGDPQAGETGPRGQVASPDVANDQSFSPAPAPRVTTGLPENAHSEAEKQRILEDRRRKAEAAWKRKNILTFDGGGIRGYWSLLVLKQLMDTIAHSEFDQRKPVQTSFHPYRLPRALTRAATNDGTDDYAATTQPVVLAEAGSGSNFLPCHYFDLICGTSTGSLIAIMLGRFRMTVEDCLDEYKTLGDKIFGRPRFWTTLRVGPLSKRHKYDAQKLEEVFADVTRRRSENLAGQYTPPELPLKPHVCQIAVTTFRTRRPGSRRPGSSIPVSRLRHHYLMRSYDHEPLGPGTQNTMDDGLSQDLPPDQEQTADTSRPRRPERVVSFGPSDGVNTSSDENRGIPSVTSSPVVPRRTSSASSLQDVSTMHPRRTNSGLNYGKAQRITIPAVARAATAAKFYFKRYEVKLNDQEELIFEDGGFALINNPTKLAKDEMVSKYGKDCIGTVVSVGTARMDDDPDESFRAQMTDVGSFATATEPTHDDMENSSRGLHSFKYYRLNAPNTVRVALDEWKPRSHRFRTTDSKRPPGQQTLDKLSKAFHEWAVQPKSSEEFRKCAEAMVQERRHRQYDRARWEGFAIAATFTCKIPGCAKTSLNRDKFRKHLRSRHEAQYRTMDNEALDRDIDQRFREYWQYRD